MDSFGNLLKLAALLFAGYVVFEVGPQVATEVQAWRAVADRGVAAVESIGKLKFWEPAGASETCQCGCGKAGCKCGK